jgi:hypothetical protein
VASHLRPLTAATRDGAERAIYTATLVFRNALFLSNILVALQPTRIVEHRTMKRKRFLKGEIELFDAQLLVEDLPVHVDPPPGPFG